MLSTGILEICKKIDQMLMAVVSLNGGIIGGVLFFLCCPSFHNDHVLLPDYRKFYP